MSQHISTITNLMTYKFDNGTWKAAFFIGNFTDAGQKTGHYELLGLQDIKDREQIAITIGDQDAALEYDTAEAAIEDTLAGRRGTPNDLPLDFAEHLYSAHKDELFKVVNPAADFDWTTHGIARKTAPVKAELVPAGTVVKTIMASGLVETKKTAGPDGGYRVTAQTGEQYLVDKAKFEKLYVDGDAPGIFVPKPEARKVLPLEQNVAFQSPWGEEMRIRSGGVLVNPGPKQIYGIQPDEYKASYTPG